MPAATRPVITDALGQTTTYAYNELNQMISETDPLKHTTTYEYNEQGRVSQGHLSGWYIFPLLRCL